MPYCRNVDDQGYPFEETWIVLRNLGSQSSNGITVRIYDESGVLLDEESGILDPSAISFIGFKPGGDLFVDPGSVESFSVEIESNLPVSGWTENLWGEPDVSDHWYDVNLLQKW